MRDRGAATKAWNTPSRIIVSDNARSFSSPGFFTSPDFTKYIFARDFGFAMPPGTTIDGHEFRNEHRVSIAGVSIILDDAKMRKADVEEGTGKTGVTLTTNVDQTNVLGGPSDLWGGTWADTDPNDVDFGCGFSYDYVSGPGGSNAQIDAIECKVTFTLPDGIAMGISSGTVISAAGSGSSWNNPTNTQGTRNKLFATQDLTDTSEFLECSNFAGLSDVTDGATIDGIRVRVRKRMDGPDVKDASIRLGTSTGVFVGNDKADAVTLWPIFSTQGDWVEYGGLADDWSASLTADQVKASTFLVAISAIAASGSHGQVDAVEVTVAFTEVTGDRAVISMMQTVG